MRSLNPKTKPRHVGKEGIKQQRMEGGSGGKMKNIIFNASLWLNLSEPQNPAKVLVPTEVAKRTRVF